MAITATERGHYAYFSSLERTIKIALAVYIVLLAAGILLLAVGLVPGWTYIAEFPYGAVAWPLAVLLSMGGMYLVVSWVHWLGALHIWLDQRFFGYLDRSNEIIFQALVKVIGSGDDTFARGMEAETRYEMIRSIFSRLAENFRLFDSLMESGIFRFWIWYWVMNYGTFTFTILTIAGSISLFSGAEPGVRTFFTICWISALAHLAANLTLGNLLTRLTRSVSESIILTYKPQILQMLRDSVANR
jgi:hypothetical protein